MRIPKALSLGLTGALLCSTAAAAQAVKWSADVTARVTYDSNVARSSDAVADLRGLEQEDVIGDILATFDLERSFGLQKAFVRGSVGYDFHRENPELDRERIDVRAGVSRKIGRCGTTLSGAYGRSQSDLEDITFEDAKNTVERTMVGVDLNCTRIIGFAPTLALSQEWVENSAEIREQSNSDTVTARVGLVYSRPALGSISLFGQFRETDFSNRVTLINGELQQDGFESYSGGLQYERNLGTRLQASIFGSYTTLNPDLPDVEGYEGITYGASLNYRPSSRLQTSLTFERDAKPSNRLDSTYSLADALSVQATYALGYRWSVNAGGSWRDGDFRGPMLRPGIDVMDEDVRSVFAGVRLKLNERLSMSMDARHTERETDVPGFDYESQRISLSAKAAF